MNSDLLNIIKDIAKNVYDSMTPASYFKGTVLSVDPISVQIDGYVQPLPSQAIDVLDSLGSQNQEETTPEEGESPEPSEDLEAPLEEELEPDPSTGEETGGEGSEQAGSDNGLKEGDRVFLIRSHGGQRFLIVGRPL